MVVSGLNHQRRTIKAHRRRKGDVQKYRVEGPTLVRLLCLLSYTFRQDKSPLLEAASKTEQRRFLKECRITLDLAGKVESWLVGWLLPSVIPIVNSMSINLKMPEGIRKLNSCLIVAPRGTGKSELLVHLLTASNPKHFVVLPAKIFEIDLVTKPRDFFHNKILVLDDLIVSFQGMSTKQRQQLENFWTKLLEGSYARNTSGIADVTVLVLFGLASEQLGKFRSELMSATFLDRVPPFKHNVPREMKRKILQIRARRSNNGSGLQRPVIKLPLLESIEDSKKVNVAFPRSKEMEEQIAEYAMELDDYGVQSSARAQDYIKTFMRANALLNGRSKVAKSDLYLYDLIHPLFLNSMGEMGMENRILALIKANPNASDNELIKKGRVVRGTFYKYKRILRDKGLIQVAAATPQKPGGGDMIPCMKLTSGLLSVLRLPRLALGVMCT
jgi:hypothetical protein